MKIPQQYLPVMPYLILNDAKGFLEFAKTVFGATEQLIVPGEERSIMHGEIKIYDAVIMFTQAGEQWTQKPAGMFIFVKDVDAVYQKALSEKAISLYAPMTEEYGYTAGLEDPFGNQWWIVKADE